MLEIFSKPLQIFKLMLRTRDKDYTVVYKNNLQEVIFCFSTHFPIISIYFCFNVVV